jgi:DNA modification methylase
MSRYAQPPNAIATIAGKPVEAMRVDSLKPNPRNARSHGRRQLKLIADSIKAFGFLNPILIDDDRVIIAGHGRWEAAKKLGLVEVPTIRLSHLNDDERRAYVIADNQLATLAGWHRDILAIELQHLITVPELEVETLGFDIPEIDLIIEDATKGTAEPREAPLESGPSVCRSGELWQLGPHRLFCGDAQDIGSYAAVLGNELADIVFTDPPYNVPIRGFVSGSADLNHREFVMGAGEMSEEAFTAFLRSSLSLMTRFCRRGAVIFACMDWRHQYELMTAFRDIGLEHLNTCVWTKDNGGMGSLYRSAHEFVSVLKVPGGKHRNNVELGKHGRNRTNVWPYPSANSFSKASDEGPLNALHSTVKPLSLITDALLDCSARGEHVLDPFLGSGSTLIAAEKIGRICHGIELDPLYIDVAIRRWQRWSGEAALHVASGKRFDAIAAELREAADV